MSSPLMRKISPYQLIIGRPRHASSHHVVKKLRRSPGVESVQAFVRIPLKASSRTVRVPPIQPWFTPSVTLCRFQTSKPLVYNVNDGEIGPGSGSDVHPPDDRTLKLGKTLRILQDRLPTLLESPLPTSVLSPHIQLHLFPSTHPHIPTISGRVAYTAALWTAPVAWGRIPLIGNVKLDILTARVVKDLPSLVKGRGGKKWSNDKAISERLIVRWKTASSKSESSGSVSRANSKIAEFLSGSTSDDEFVGLFIFEFDEEGRVLTHTIEHVEEGGSWETEPRVMGLGDWLLGRRLRLRRGNGTAEGGPGLAVFSPWRGFPL